LQAAAGSAVIATRYLTQPDNLPFRHSPEKGNPERINQSYFLSFVIGNLLVRR